MKSELSCLSCSEEQWSSVETQGVGQQSIVLVRPASLSGAAPRVQQVSVASSQQQGQDTQQHSDQPVNVLMQLLSEPKMSTAMEVSSRDIA